MISTKKKIFASLFGFGSVSLLLLFQNCSRFATSSDFSSASASLGSEAATGLNGVLISASAQDLSETINWMRTDFAPDEYIAFHAQTRLPHDWDPQKSHSVEELTNSSPWFSVNAGEWKDVVGLSRMEQDTSTSQIYWRKDYMHALNPLTQNVENANFAGELFTYDNDHVYVRTETFFDLSGTGVSDPDTKYATAANPQGLYARIDKFRLFAQTTTDNPQTNAERFPGGRGRLFAPRIAKEGWEKRQAFDILFCFSFSDYAAGQCPNQNIPGGFKDIVSVNFLDGFDTNFDGVASGFEPAPEFRAFDKVLIISVRMGQNFDAMERYYFGYRKGRFYGIVRWDASQLNSKNQWIIYNRTVGLKISKSSEMSFAGLRTRGAHEKDQHASPPVSPPPTLPTQPQPEPAPSTQVTCEGDAGIQRLYNEILARNSSATDIAYYRTELQNGRSFKGLRVLLASSAEFSARFSDDPSFVSALYGALLNRAGSATEISYYANRIASGASRNDIVTGFGSSQEFAALPACY